MAGTIVVDRIESDGSYASTINVASKVNFTGGMQIGGQDTTFAGMRNRIINGAMMIDQRNVGASVSNANGYTLDRWYMMRGNVSSNPVFNVQQSLTVPSGFKNSLAITVATSGAPGTTNYASLFQRIEGLNISDFAWGTATAAPITLSFWINCSVTGTYGVSFQNDATNRSYVATYSINQANTWEYKTITIPGDTTGAWLTSTGTGVGLYWDLGVGTTQSTTSGTWQAGNYLGLTNGTKLSNTNGATFYITGVQLEKGSVATPFEHRLYGQELALCQRYYQTGRMVLFPTVLSADQGTAIASRVYNNEMTLGVPLRISGATATVHRYDKATITNGTYISRVTNEGDYSGLVNATPYLRHTEPNTFFAYLSTSNNWYPVPIYFTISAEL